MEVLLYIGGAIIVVAFWVGIKELQKYFWRKDNPRYGQEDKEDEWK